VFAEPPRACVVLAPLGLARGKIMPAAFELSQAATNILELQPRGTLSLLMRRSLGLHIIETRPYDRTCRLVRQDDLKPLSQRPNARLALGERARFGELRCKRRHAPGQVDLVAISAQGVPGHPNSILDRHVSGYEKPQRG
jgi:hypothetical protein